MVDKAKVEKCRQHVAAYQAAHLLLYKNGWYRGVPEDHTPVLKDMVDKIKKEGYKSLEEFESEDAELKQLEGKE